MSIPLRQLFFQFHRTDITIESCYRPYDTAGRGERGEGAGRVPDSGDEAAGNDLLLSVWMSKYKLVTAARRCKLY